MKSVIALVAGALVAIAVMVAADRTGVIDLSSSDETTTSTTVRRTTTTDAAPTTTTSPSPDPAVALWPPPGASDRYDSPEEAARTFAAQFIGFEQVIVEPFQAGDPSSGEVPVRTRPDGPITTVLVRQLLPGSWWATGAITDRIRLTDPGPGDRVSSPLPLEGAAHTFEGNVQVEVRADNASKPVGNGFVTGGGDQLTPFSGSVRFDEDAARPAEFGAVLLFESSADNGQTTQATVTRVAF